MVWDRSHFIGRLPTCIFSKRLSPTGQIHARENITGTLARNISPARASMGHSRAETRQARGLHQHPRANMGNSRARMRQARAEQGVSRAQNPLPCTRGSRSLTRNHHPSPSLGNATRTIPLVRENDTSLRSVASSLSFST